MVRGGTPRLALPEGGRVLSVSLDMLFVRDKPSAKNYCHTEHGGQQDTTIGMCEVICHRKYQFVKEYFLGF
jgi:hypothetical protein